MDNSEKYLQWRKMANGDEELVLELASIEGDEQAINDRFYTDLKFGTGGLRGKLGAGTNRINIYTVGKATQGLANYLKSEYKNPGVAIAYDSRKNSELFARKAAEIFAANGAKAHIFKELKPTPMLSFAVRELKLSAGIVITASHNPAIYNGYKVYGSDGCQITEAAAKAITAEINAVDIFAGVKTSAFEQALSNGEAQYIADDVEEAYYAAVIANSQYDQAAAAGLKVVYTPLNGTGNKPVRRILNMTGIEEVLVVSEQELPDPSFTTCPFPNPEERESLQLGLELAKNTDADLLLGTDPDCDRVGAAVNHRGEFVLLDGNQTGVLLLDYICSMRSRKNTLPKNPVAIKTIVTSEMSRVVAQAYGVQNIDVLTGFKYIGEQIGLLEARGEQQRFIFGMEESYGYLAGSYVRDKDAVVASMLIAEMAAYYKSKGKTLIDALEGLYEKHGYYVNKLSSYAYEGESGMDTMNALMQKLRDEPPKRLAGRDVVFVADYKKGIVKTAEGQKAIGLPESNVIKFGLKGGSAVVARPSGTEPKLKVYYLITGKDREACEQLLDSAVSDMQRLI